MDLAKPSQKIDKIGFIGAGALGLSLARSLIESGYKVAGIWTRTISRTEQIVSNMPGTIAYNNKQNLASSCNLVFITVPDDAINGVADSIAWKPGQFVVHCSGIHSRGILQNAENHGAVTGGFHPLQTFPSYESEISLFKGITFGIDALTPLDQVLESIGQTLGGNPVSITGKDRVIYHASATMVCALLVVLINLAADLWKHFQVPICSQTNNGLNALMPLIRSTLNNLEANGPVNALTGPFARGDIGTISQHIEKLRRETPGLLEIYGRLGIVGLPLAKAKGNLTREQIESMEHLLTSGINLPGIVTNEVRDLLEKANKEGELCG